MSQMQAPGRRPPSAARHGAQASPPPRPALETTLAPSIPVSPAADRASPGPRRGGSGSPRKPAGRKGRPPRRVRGLLHGTAPPPSPAVPGHPIGLQRVGDARLGACSPPRAPAPLHSPSAAGHARQDPAQRPPAGAPGLRALSAPPARPGRPSFPPCGARREGQGLRAGTAGTSGRPTLGSAAPQRREPRAPSRRRTRPGPSGPQRRKEPPRRRQHAAPAAAAGPHLHPLLLAFPSARKNAANFLKTFFFAPTDTHERDKGDTTIHPRAEAQKRELAQSDLA